MINKSSFVFDLPENPAITCTVKVLGSLDSLSSFCRATDRQCSIGVILDKALKQRLGLYRTVAKFTHSAEYHISSEVLEVEHLVKMSSRAWPNLAFLLEYSLNKSMRSLVIIQGNIEY